VHAPFVLRIGHASKPLAEFYAQFGVDCAAFITAYNPHSEAAADEQNAAKQSEYHQKKTPEFDANAKSHHPHGFSAEL
jgi:hypothetical protein